MYSVKPSHQCINVLGNYRIEFFTVSYTNTRDESILVIANQITWFCFVTFRQSSWAIFGMVARSNWTAFLLFSFISSITFCTSTYNLNVMLPWMLLYSGLISRGKIFVGWIIKSFCRYVFKDYRISSTNTTSSISTPVQYYSNTNNIDMVVIFISSAPLNSTTRHFATLDIIAKHCVTKAVSLIIFEL